MSAKNNISLAAEYFNKGYELHLNGNISSAIFYYKQSIKNHPTAKAHTFLGWSYSLLGEFEDAIQECKKAIELDPGYGSPYNDIGTYLVNLGKDSEAVIWFEKAIDIADYRMKYYTYFNLGRIYEKKGDWFTAINYFEEALEIKPDYDAAKFAFLRLTSMMN